jgi:hypothetical protein
LGRPAWVDRRPLAARCGPSQHRRNGGRARPRRGDRARPRRGGLAPARQSFSKLPMCWEAPVALRLMRCSQPMQPSRRPSCSNRHRTCRVYLNHLSRISWWEHRCARGAYRCVLALWLERWPGFEGTFSAPGNCESGRHGLGPYTAQERARGRGAKCGNHGAGAAGGGGERSRGDTGVVARKVGEGAQCHRSSVMWYRASNARRLCRCSTKPVARSTHSELTRGPFRRLLLLWWVVSSQDR